LLQPTNMHIGGIRRPCMNGADTMQLDDFDRSNFPKLARYLREDFPRLAAIAPPVIRGLKKWGRMSALDIQNCLRWGSGPVVAMTMIGAEHYPTKIEIGLKAAVAYEMDSQMTPLPHTTRSFAVMKNSRGGLVYRVGIVILLNLVEGNLRLLAKKSPAPTSTKLDWIVAEALEGFIRDVYGSLAATKHA
jgi:hypothetical protein